MFFLHANLPLEAYSVIDEFTETYHCEKQLSQAFLECVKPGLRDAQVWVRQFHQGLMLIIGDGNCLYRCFAVHFEGTESRHDLVRQVQFTREDEIGEG